MAQDIDEIAGLMYYIQLSLLGCAGYVCIADSLLYPVTGESLLRPRMFPEQDFWFTPALYTDTWVIRRLLERLPEAPPSPSVETPVITDAQGKEALEAERSAFDINLTEKESGQFSLF